MNPKDPMRLDGGKGRLAVPHCYKDPRRACDGSCGNLMPGGWCLELYGGRG